jgi:hypothetical protein
MHFVDPLDGTFLRNFGEIQTNRTAVNDLVGNALVGEQKMTVRLVERRVIDRVLDDDVVHSVPVLWIDRLISSVAQDTTRRHRTINGKTGVLLRQSTFIFYFGVLAQGALNIIVASPSKTMVAVSFFDGAIGDRSDNEVDA